MSNFSVEATLREAVAAACAEHASKVSDPAVLDRVATRLVALARRGEASDDVVSALLAQLEDVLAEDGP